jgi:nitroreductase/NAD-dependent dihydropyrimidine dehydrogenase PreA subunit
MRSHRTGITEEDDGKMTEMISFDADKCTKCGICLEVCPMGIIFRDGDKPPFIPGELLSRCIKCGHCESYCPTGAVATGFEGYLPADKRVTPRFLAPDDLKVHMLSRRTARVFMDKPVEREKIEEIMDSVRYAPSGGNNQPVKWFFVSGREKVHRIAANVAAWMASVDEKDQDSQFAEILGKIAGAFHEGKDMITRGAHQLVLTAVPKDNPWAETDAVIAMTWFEILCQAWGIGTCWLGMIKMPATDDPSVIGHLGIPDGYELGYAMVLGYPKYKVRSIPKRNAPDITWL